MGPPIKHVANCFLQRDFEDQCATITPMKLQKLVYCLHGWHLAITGKPAIKGNFEAWPYGPVEEDMYHLFKSYRNKPITAYAKSWDGDEHKAFVVAQSKNKEFYDILDFVAGRYTPFSATQLSAMTHKPGTPWSVTRDNWGTIIPDILIQEYFRTLATK